MSLLFFRVLPAALALVLLLAVANEYATARPSNRTSDIAYVPASDSSFQAERHQLDVYAPKNKRGVLRPVVVFIHGGNWDSGNKNFYSFIGRRLAKQGVVAVIINYRLSPMVRVPEMADDCARAVIWTAAHIEEYGGDSQRIFVMGHSAGGGLAALLTADNRLFERRGLSQNPIRGAILDDPAGLDMYDYLQKQEYPGDAQYLVPFGQKPEVWRQVSALYHVAATTPPYLIFVGSETYPSILSSSARFQQKLTELGKRPQYTVLPGKKHVPMVLQLYWQHNIIYRELLSFVELK